MTSSESPPSHMDDVEEFHIADLIAFNPAEDPDSLLGTRWLGRGGSCLLYGPAGGGKSSLRTHAAVTWAMGQPWFGIKPKEPLKSLIIQAENDRGDEAEMFMGAARQLGIDPAELEGRVVIERITGKVGPEFTGLLDKRLAIHNPHLVWVDPLFSYAGEDLSLQKQASDFLRVYLDPVLKKHQVAAILLHHAGKPPKGRADRDALDHTSSYFGSVELAAYPRAMMCLYALEAGGFALSATKRGKRAGLRDLDGNIVDTIHLEHASAGIGWEQVVGPAEGEEGGGAGRKDRLEEYVDNRILYAPKSRELEAPSRQRIMEKMGLGERQVKAYEARFKVSLKKFNRFSFN